MSYPTFTKQMLATFTGRPLASFPEFVEASAFPQALLLFKMGTCLASPDGLSEDETQLMTFAIMSMADAIHLSQPYAAAVASPFSSESIGSYSYSKAAKAVQKGELTGVMWFDMAVNALSICEDIDNLPMGGGIEVFEHDGIFVPGNHDNVRYLSPADLNLSRNFGYDPAPTSSYGG